MRKPLTGHGPPRPGSLKRYRLTLYDAAYLELAQRRKLPLATLDQDLIRAGKALGMTLLRT